jgi:UDP-2,3-diacylglucosamine pyrophosphatase LpxH
MTSDTPTHDHSTTERSGLSLGYVVSDFHIFAKWSSADSYIADVRAAAAAADFFVFNGDIFDFKWSTLESSEATTRAAIEWFRQLASDFPRCHFFYVLGNHDCHVSFIDPLNSLADELDNFSWHNSYCRIGTWLFMHGDLIFKAQSGTPFERTHLSTGEPRHSLLGTSYHIVISMGAHALAALMFAKEKCAKQLLKVLKGKGYSGMEGVEDIYIGHTHAAFSDFKYGGFTFHNSGSAVHDLHCNMMQVGSKEKL